MVPSTHLLESNSFVSSKAMNVFLDNDMVLVKEKVLETSLLLARPGDAVATSMGPRCAKDEEEFNDFL